MTDSPLVIALNMGTLLGLPAWSAAPTGDATSLAKGLRVAGYAGIQGATNPVYRAFGFKTYGSGRVVERKDAQDVLARQQADGHLATTLHVGTGLESDAQAMGLIEAILTASDHLGHPAHIETHRATITQDIWRTLRWIEHFPEMTFNADLSHWYTGLEMAYGDFEGKLTLLAPFFHRVRFVHGRIGTGGIMQVAIKAGGRDEPHLGRFSRMWALCFSGFLQADTAGQSIVFAPELLPEQVETPTGPLPIDYAVPSRSQTGDWVETTDRWDQALKLVDVAKASFQIAQAMAAPALAQRA
ncbi:hypothetical protein [uncultured Devosia sp.]|uniref:hypothetical protein n=1 Tax=uncultured Devosia sp. TaxID=211434 RepID=UPI0035CA856C